MFVVISLGEGKYEVTAAPEDEANLVKAASLAGLDVIGFIRASVNDHVASALKTEQPGT